jgi:group I intron endonuclease
VNGLKENYLRRLEKNNIVYNCGIYRIRNIETGDIYIGQSHNLSGRKYQHFWELRKGISKSYHLQNAYNKYGKDSFVFEIILFCENDKSILTYYEQTLVDLLNPAYNIKKECVESRLGVKATEETRKRQSDKKKGVPFTKEHKENLAKSLGKGPNNKNFGKHPPEKTRKKMSESSKKNNFWLGRKHTEESKKKMSDSQSGEKHRLWGKHQPEETKRKISESNKGKKRRKWTDEEKKKKSESMMGEKNHFFGKKHSEEAIMKISKSHRKKDTHE